ncbi:MAG: glycoside hydrolase family 16 protein, partial [Muribaculaceae bacterium]|nr:glycoside hydrolase family 16 protein [Muribaculaceae bacterium]
GIHGQLITANRGAIADALVYLHRAGETGLTVNAPNCAVTDLAGNLLSEKDFTPGRKLSVLLAPDRGYRVVSARIESGSRLEAEGVEFANPSMTHRTLEIPLAEMMDYAFEIPAANTYGNVVLPVEVEEGSDPALDYYSSALEGTKAADGGITSVSAASEGTSGTLDCATTLRHTFIDSTPLAARTGSAAVFTVGYSGNAAELRLLADLGQTGSFDGATTATAAPGEPISLDIPAGTAPGVYRARLEAPGECDVDFLLNIHDGACGIYSEILNGNIWGPRSSPLPLTAEFGKPLRIVPAPTLEGFAGAKLTVRHGHNVFGRQYLRGNRQWDEFEIPAVGATDLAAEEVDGSIYVFGAYADTPDGEWTLVWSDEFADDHMDTSKWDYHPRYGSTWNRFCAVGDERPLVNRFDQGMYRSYCVKTPDEFSNSETQEMVSGAIYTAGKFYLNGGYVEARCKTLPHSGNFQAFWMMPVDQSAGWPSCGEIDIWEQINTENLAYGSLHHAWRYPTDSSVKNQYGSISKTCPFSGSTRSGVDASLWHTYAIEWDSEHISWLIDGVKFATATNPHYSEGKWTEAVTWPFDKHYYIICNQSVGNGSWAANPDLDFEYRTDFDYVRAYQKKDRLDYYSSADGSVAGIENVTVGNGEADSDTPVEYYTLQGIRVAGESPRPGVYIRRQGHTATKVIVR